MRDGAGEVIGFRVADVPIYVEGPTKLYHLGIFTDGTNAATARATWSIGPKYEEVNVRCAATDYKEFTVRDGVAVGGAVTVDLVGTTSRGHVVVDRYARIRTGYGKAARLLVCRVTKA